MIKNGKIVDLSYCLKDSEGEVLDQSSREEPFSYLHGAQEIVPGLENALEGLKVGDKREVTVPPEQGYGEVNPGLKLVVKRSQFQDGTELEEGMSFEASGGEGHGGEGREGREGMMFTIESIEGEDVHIDGNHPLAGVTLHFSVEVLGIRDATAEELEHGHAHGPDGNGGHEHSH